MPPRSYTNPAPKTESARAAARSFFCDLCQKGYARMNELDAHLSSYDHAHRKRLQDMKKMQSDPRAAEKARRAERKEAEKTGLVSIKLDPKTKKSGGGFTKIGGDSGVAGKDGTNGMAGFTKIGGNSELGKKVAPEMPEDDESDTDDEGYEYYDPRKPTDCDGNCPGLI